jgi:hypothetical protein
VACARCKGGRGGCGGGDVKRRQGVLVLCCAWTNGAARGAMIGWRGLDWTGCARRSSKGGQGPDAAGDAWPAGPNRPPGSRQAKPHHHRPAVVSSEWSGDRALLSLARPPLRRGVPAASVCLPGSGGRAGLVRAAGPAGGRGREAWALCSRQLGLDGWSTVKVAVDVATGPGDRGGSQFKNGTLTRSSTPATYSTQRT